MSNSTMLKHLRMHLLFIFPCVLSYSYPASRIHTDQASLLRFKEDIVHDPQGFLGNWNETTSVCEWNGVVCTEDGDRVSELLLKSKFLEGTISPFLSNLTALVLLELSDNSLVGPIPAELGTLPNLQLLGMQGNKLKSEIPSSFAQLSNLQYIDLSKNKIGGPLPSALLYNCTQLAYIDLSSNLFTGSIPSQIGEKLPFLENLLLYFNQLSGVIPSSLSNSTRMVELDLENNFLNGTLPSEIVVKMPMLKILHLSYNQLSSNADNNDLHPFFTAISNLTHLEELELAANNLSGEIPSTIGLLHVNVSQIHLEDNAIHGVIPKTIANMSSLTLLNLSNNLLNGTIPPEISLLPKLERLCLSRNLLHGDIPTNLGALNHLGLLDLSENMLTGPIPTSLENITQLRKLLLNMNSLSGTIPPSLGRCITLELIDLSHNSLTGNIPAPVAGLSNIAIYFNMSNNQLTGRIPMELGRMERVWEIDLSSNSLTGEIPPSIGSCQEVVLLNLSHNSLTGKVPATLGNLLTLKYLDLSANSLSGEIPDALEKCSNLVQLNLSFNNFSGSLPAGGVFDNLSYDTVKGNPHICGSPTFLPSCDLKKTSTEHSRKFLVSVVSIVSISAFLLTICGVLSLRRIRFLFQQKERDPDLTTTSVESVVSYPRITYKELWEATAGFEQSRLIGSGSFGHVYRGVLGDGTVVAVKVLQLQTRNSSKSFSRECQVLKRIRHRNLIRIITACSLPDFKALVLPFMANGNLESHLYPQETNPNVLPLSLIERLNICSDIAEGMAYLHHHSPVQVIHCDLKPSNVLLNDEMTALVSDFGISRLITKVEGNPAAENTMNSTANLVVGSFGYVAPEYGFGRSASTKGDVYSFGILLIEVLTRKKPTDNMFCGGTNLQTWVKNHYHNELRKIIDHSILSSLWNKNQEIRKTWEVVLVEIIEIALHCAQESPSTRPTMIDVAEDLDRLKRYLGGDTTATLTSSQGASSSSIAGADEW